jgi:hypothetical protein
LCRLRRGPSSKESVLERRPAGELGCGVQSAERTLTRKEMWAHADRERTPTRNKLMECTLARARVGKGTNEVNGMSRVGK